MQNVYGRHDAYVELRDFSGEIPVGETRRTVCFFCGGGTKRESTLSITRASAIETVFHCFRANCGKSGRLLGRGQSLVRTTSELRSSRPEFTPRVYSGVLDKLDQCWLSEIFSRYSISKEETDWAGWRIATDTDRLACKVRGPDYLPRGYELRNLLGYAGLPKTQAFREVPNVWMGWYRRSQTGPVCVVEDLVSALKVSRWAQACSLMGSSLSSDHIEEIQKVAKGGLIILALDRDAYHKAIKYFQEWRLIVPNFSPVLLSKDLKYENDEEIRRIVRNS